MLADAHNGVWVFDRNTKEDAIRSKGSALDTYWRVGGGAAMVRALVLLRWSLHLPPCYRILKAALPVHLVEKLVVDESANDTDFATQYPILAICLAFALLVENVPSFEVEV